MLRKLFAAMFAAACLALSTSDAQALYVTTHGEVQAKAVFASNEINQDSPPLEQIWRVDGAGGFAFTNLVSGSLATGGEVRNVTAEIIASAQNGTNFPIFVGDVPIVAFSATTGMLALAGISPVVDVTGGRLFLAQMGAGFNLEDPNSWASTWANVFAEYELGPKMDIISGQTVGVTPAGAADLPLDAALVNLQTPDAVDPNNAILRLVFLEDSTAEQNAGVIVDGMGNQYLTGDNFIELADTPVPGLVKEDEGIYSNVNTRIENLTLAQLGTNDADLTVLNQIAAAAGLSDLDGVAAGNQAFASLYASNLGQPTEYRPAGSPTSGTFNGDARSAFTTQNYFINSLVPEPTSMALFGMGAMVCGACGIRRRKQQAKTEVSA